MSLRPTASADFSEAAVVGGPDAPSVLADESDSSSIQAFGSGPSQVITKDTFTYDESVIPDGAFINQYLVKMRATTTSSGSIEVIVTDGTTPPLPKTEGAVHNIPNSGFHDFETITTINPWTQRPWRKGDLTDYPLGVELQRGGIGDHGTNCYRLELVVTFEALDGTLQTVTLDPAVDLKSPDAYGVFKVETVGQGASLRPSEALVDLVPGQAFSRPFRNFLSPLTDDSIQLIYPIYRALSRNILSVRVYTRARSEDNISQVYNACLFRRGDGLIIQGPNHLGDLNSPTTVDAAVADFRDFQGQPWEGSQIKGLAMGFQIQGSVDTRLHVGSLWMEIDQEIGDPRLAGIPINPFL